MERGDRTERCACPYICSRANPELGYQQVFERTKRKHADMDRKGKLASDAGISRSQSYMARENVPYTRKTSSDVNCIPPRGRSEHFGQQAHPISIATCPLISRSTAYRDAKALVGAVNRSFNFPTLDDSFPVDSYFTADVDGEIATAARIITYTPTLDEAIYRSTWKFQALLDKNNVSIELQESILAILFGPDAPRMLPDGRMDYRDMSLGSLLRYAGREWRGGELRLRGLCSLNAISRLYRDQGMPTVERWRFCLGEGDTAHAPLTYGTSKQDDYTKSGLKCNCAHRPSTGLQRECEICTERCAVTSCRLQRKNMESFDYIPIGSMLRLICRSRTYCHSMLSMWRAKHRWFMPDETAVNVVPTFPIKDWWDGTKAKEISWFWDSGKTWELPVVCAACQEVYQAFPAKCQMLISNFVITLIVSSRAIIQRDPRNIPLLAHWDGFKSASIVFRSTWTVETKVLSPGSASPLPPMPVLFIPNTKGDPSNKFEALNACLRPLMAELINLFVNGVDVVYNYPSELIDNRDLPRRFKLRAMLVLFTGDLPAQCKFGGFASSGYSACRRCKMNASLHVQHGPNSRPGGVVVYDCNRRQYRHSPARKTITELRQAVLELNACKTSAARKEVSQRTSVVADSNVWKLYDLYGFNPSLDLTYEAMHVLAVSMFKKYTELLKKDSERTSAGHDALIAGLAEGTKKKPRSFRGRWPKDPFNRLGYFKAEEYSNFVI
ncbi:hypothetical protein R1sor_000737 [Riccia sorocarpa]|uniref:Transposase n=1 Tax=Riccia sorocarpa TaxID=122646 RepID=A0ABD3GX46_9MARC